MPLSRIKSKMEVSQLRLNSSAASTDENERVLLDGTDSSDTNDGYAVILEDATDNALFNDLASLSADVRFNTMPFIPTPTFRANKTAAAQDFSNATFTKIVFDYEDFDIGGYYDNTTNYRYTPLVAGYYLVNTSVSLASANDHDGGLIGIYINGGLWRFNRIFLTGLTNEDFYTSTFTYTGTIEMNGTTDYIEVYYYSYSEDSGACQIGADNRATYFEATLLQRTN